jgi:7,8-dihydropterin-6-yl-methyl-4-(beta-D-ribofuranosyl)aminobenzene 5'-phosphate synthase
MAPVDLKPVDALEVTVLADNFVDVLLPGSASVRRAPRRPDSFEREGLIAEHGYSLLVTVQLGGRRESLLCDAGLGRDTVQHNLDVLEMRTPELRAIVLSPGHADHHGGLEGLVAERAGRSSRLFCTPMPGERGARCSTFHFGPVANE